MARCCAQRGSLLFLLVACFAAEVASQTDKRFLQDVLHFYGENDSLSTASLENFLHLIAARRSASIVDDENPLKDSECMSVGELLQVHGLGNLSEVSVGHLEAMCPAVLIQVLLPSCPHTRPTQHRPAHYQVWGYGFLAVTVINLASLLGLLVLPFTEKPYFPKVITYFIGLAIGTLFSNAILQLIPEALGFDPKVDNYVLKVIGIFGGFYLLFFTEKILKIALKAESEHSHSHSPPPLKEITTSFSNDIIINTISDDVNTNNVNNDKSSHLNTTSANKQEARVRDVACGWLCGKRLSSIKTVAWMVTLSDALHNFIDGLAIGASFTISPVTGFSTSLAIICEEFPHELGDFVILLSSGMSVGQAVFFNLLSSMACYLGLTFGILLGSSFAPNAIFAIAGGMFLYIALADMFPEMNAIMAAQERSSLEKITFFLLQNAGLLTGFSIILLITLFAGDINLG